MICKSELFYNACDWSLLSAQSETWATRATKSVHHLVLSIKYRHSSLSCCAGVVFRRVLVMFKTTSMNCLHMTFQICTYCRNDGLRHWWRYFVHVYCKSSYKSFVLFRWWACFEVGAQWVLFLLDNRCEWFKVASITWGTSCGKWWPIFRCIHEVLLINLTEIKAKKREFETFCSAYNMENENCYVDKERLIGQWKMFPFHAFHKLKIMETPLKVSSPSMLS